MAALLFGLVVILVPIVTEADLAARVNGTISSRFSDNLSDEVYTPFQGKRFENFDWSLCKKLSTEYSGNMIISPISIKIALSVLYEGVIGQAAYEIAGALQLPDSRASARERSVSVLRSLQAVRPEYATNISTRIIVDRSIVLNERYVQTIKNLYATAEIVSANLIDSHAALEFMNDWVSRLTHGHIKQVFSDKENFKESLFLVLDALYFRGTWQHYFSPELTRIGNFFTDVDSNVKVPYMNNVGYYRYLDAADMDAQILRLPYLGQKYAMFIVLPRTRTGIRELVDKLNPSTLRWLIQQMEDVAVDVSIPKFKLESSFHLKNVLRELGILEIFRNTASLGDIALADQQDKKIVVSDFVQTVGLEVDEFGIPEQAVTVFQFGYKVRETVFFARHPFLFFIEDETTGSLVCFGKVTNPLEQS